MVISKIYAGFGNQLFMYAIGYAKARQLHTRLALDATYIANDKARSFELSRLNLKYDKLYFFPRWMPRWLNVPLRKVFQSFISVRYKRYQEKKSYIYDTHVAKLGDKIWLSGYWQNERYFADYRAEILSMLTPSYTISEECRKLIIEVKRCNSVAIHIRRGDYVKLGITLDDSYYHNAMDLIEKRIPSPEYFIFSDDKDYAKSLFEKSQRQCHFVTYNAVDSTIEDFLIMRSCKHIITANSSYSWWAAWANENEDKIVIYPKISPIAFLNDKNCMTL